MAYKKNTRKLPYRLLITGAVLLIGAGAAGWFVYRTAQKSDPAPSTSSGAKLDLSPATPQDQAESDKLKEDSAAPPPSDPNTGSKKTVTPFIVDASQYPDGIEVRVNVPGIVENGGTCTFTFVNGSQTFTRQTSGSADATTTRCENLLLARSDFPSMGKWSVKAVYDSSSATGSSATATLEVK